MVEIMQMGLQDLPNVVSHIKVEGLQCFASINVLKQWIFKKLRTLLHQRRREADLRKAVLTNSIKLVFKNWEDNSSCCRWRIMRRFFSILIGSHISPIKWRATMNLFLIKPLWIKWCALCP